MNARILEQNGKYLNTRKNMARFRLESAIYSGTPLPSFFDQMQFEYAFQSIPFNCSLLETAKTRPIFGEFLELYGLREVSFEELRFRSGDEDFAIFTAETKRVREMFPGIDLRRLELGASRDALIELFEHSRNATLGKAVAGGDILGVSICSTRGVPISFLPPYLVKRISEEFDRHTYDKMTTGQAVSPISDSVRTDFEKLGDFYRFAAAFDEGVVTIAL